MLRSVPSARDQERHMAPLRLALLGAPSVEVGGAPLRVDTRKAVALLAYLACSGRRHGRDQLATLLWPEADDAHARAALRRTLSALNHALGGVARVAADRSGLELVAPGMVLDIERFRKLVASCDAHGHEPDRACSRCAEPLAEAVALHRGDFLAGFALRDAPEFEDWQLAEADTLRRELAAALQRLVDAEAVRGRWQAAIADAERWLALDPLHEPAHRQLMRLYAWSGQRGAAMRKYRACVRILDEELGVSPLEETTALYQQVTEGGVEPPPTPPPEAAIPTPPPAAAARAAAPGGPAPPPLDGRGRLVALTGEAGVGKTRLAEAFAAQVATAHSQVLVCRCYEGERLAYGPLADGLRAALARPEGGAWARALEPHWLAEAARLLPELAPLLLLAIWRDEDVPRGHHLRRVAAEAQRAGTTGTLALDRLDRAATAALVDAVAPAHSAAAEELYRRSEGLPLLLVAYLAALDDGDEGLPALPSGARELLQARLERVSEAAWQLLTAAAVIGRSFDVDIVREASGRSDDEAIGAIEELVRLGLIHELSGPATSYDFSHEQVRLLVYEQAGLARRRLLHRRVAQALARVRDTEDQAAPIAHHFQLAGHDAEAAAWFARAGERAAALYANREAVAHYQAALALGRPDGAARLQLALGDLYTLLGEYGGALAAYEAAAARCQPRDLAMVEHKLGSLHHRRGDWEAAEVHLEAALAALDAAEGTDSASRARLVADQSLTAHRRGRSDQAAELAVRALELADAAGDPAALAQCHNLVGMLAAGAGDHERARRHLERSLAFAQALPDPAARVAALNNLALSHQAAGRLDQAIELAAEALDPCSAQGDRHRQAALHNNLADLFHAAGQPDEAMRHLKLAVAIFAEVGERDRLEPAIWQLVEW